MTALSVARLRDRDNPDMWIRNCGLGIAVVALASLALAQELPPSVATALKREHIPVHAVSLLVLATDGTQRARLSHRANVPMNPASVMKLVSTYAALDLLGPAWRWHTPVYVLGSVRDGTLHGDLLIRGQGDPTLVTERIWLLLRRVQGLGIRAISGDIILDQSAFEPVADDPASFDGEPLRPYNVAADALLLNFKSVQMTFVPNLAAGSAAVQFEPPLGGVQMQRSVPLSTFGGCGDYRSALDADFSDPAQIRFAGSYPPDCGEKTWSVAYAEPNRFNERAVLGLWLEMGGTLGGVVRSVSEPGAVPSSPPPVATFELVSPPLAEVIRDINKYSNNVMAQQLFLTLSLPDAGSSDAAGGSSTLAGSATVLNASASRQASRARLDRWWRERINAETAPQLDNGSGLSRSQRISAQALAQLLQSAYQSRWMPELVASLPIIGIDGTLKRSQVASLGGAHLKTGSLRDVTALAGYVRGSSGKTYVLVAIANHPNANAARAAFAALLDWTVRDEGKP